MIGIVIPVYNGWRHLAATLDSVVAQTVTDWRAVVVDDGSTDDSREIAEEFAASDSRVSVVAQANAGVSAARNRGFAELEGACDRIIFLDGDDLWEADALATLGAALDANPDAAGAYGLARYIDVDGELVDVGVLEKHQRARFGVEGDSVIAWPVERATTFEVEAVFEAIITCGTVLLRREAFEAAGKWDESLKLWEDWDLWLSVTQVGDLAFVNKPVLRYRRHEGNASRDAAKLDAGVAVVRRRLIDSLADDADRRRVAVAGALYYRGHLARQRREWAFADFRRGRILSALKNLRHAFKIAGGPAY